MKLAFLFLLFKVIIIQVSVAQTFGCTDPLAINYNPEATNNDGSCIYPEASVSASFSVEIDDVLDETSGLIFWDGYLWTHNDDTDLNLYKIDTIQGKIIDKYYLEGVDNIDWEEVTQDDKYIYMGDFGNNFRGNRTDLKILRIDKQSLLDRAPIIDSINFVYEDQTDFSQQPPNYTSFDCEAFIVVGDSLYLFTKDWVNEITCVYSIPKVPGDYTAKKLSCYDVEGLVTGMTYLEEKNLIVLCGYNEILQVFLYLLYDFEGTDFFGGNKRKLTLNLPFHQIEAIETTDGLKYYLTNEYFSQMVITVLQKFHIVYLDEFLADYLENLPSSIEKQNQGNYIEIFPNPANQINISIKSDRNEQFEMNVFHISGKHVYKKDFGFITEKFYYSIDNNILDSGIYIIDIKGSKLTRVTKKIILL